jgi:hypothetical protein
MYKSNLVKMVIGLRPSSPHLFRVTGAISKSLPTIIKCFIVVILVLSEKGRGTTVTK